jgi:hypothetical protein
LPLPAAVETIIRYCVHRLRFDGVKFETVSRDVTGIAMVAALGGGVAGGAGRLAAHVRYGLNEVLGAAIQTLSDERRAARKGSVYALTPEQAAEHALEIVEAKAAEQLGKPKKLNGKMNGKANGHAHAA